MSIEMSVLSSEAAGRGNAAARHRAGNGDAAQGPGSFMSALSSADAQAQASMREMQRPQAEPVREREPQAERPREAKAPRETEAKAAREDEGKGKKADEAGADGKAEGASAAADPVAAPASDAALIGVQPVPVDAALLLAQGALAARSDAAASAAATAAPGASGAAVGAIASVLDPSASAAAVAPNAALAPAATAVAVATDAAQAARDAAAAAAAVAAVATDAQAATAGDEVALASLLARSARAQVGASGEAAEAAATPVAPVGGHAARTGAEATAVAANPATGSQVLLRTRAGLDNAREVAPPATLRQGQVAQQRQAALADAAQAAQSAQAAQNAQADLTQAVPAEVAAARTDELARLATPLRAETSLPPLAAEAGLLARRPEADRAAGHGASTTGIFGAGGSASVERSAFMPPVTAASASADVGAGGLAERMTEQVNFWVASKLQGAEIKLDTAAGHAVTVNVQIQGNEAQVAFRSDQAELRQVINQSLPQLEKMLGAEGLMLTGATVGGHESAAGQSSPDGQPTPSTVGARLGAARAGGAEAEAPRAPAPSRVQAPSGRTLDLYV